MIEGTKVLNEELIGLFQAEEGGIESWTGGIGEGKTYGASLRAVRDLEQGNVVYTSWPMILDKLNGDQRKNFWQILRNIITFNKRFFKFDIQKNWHYIDYEDRSTWHIERTTDKGEKYLEYYTDFVEFLTNLTDCIVYLDEGQDIFDSYEGTKMSKSKRKVLTRTRHLRKTLVIISQRYQAIPPTARRNVKVFHKHVKAFTIFGRPFFKVYSTSELDNSDMPVFDPNAKASDRYWGQKRIFETFNSWYLRGGIPISQDIHFEAFDFSFIDRFRLLLSLFSNVRLKPNIRGEKIFGPKTLGVKRETASIKNDTSHNKVMAILKSGDYKIGSTRRVVGGEEIGVIHNSLEAPPF